MTPASGGAPDGIDLYKFAVEMADRVSARRGSANAYFLTVETTLLAVISLATSNLAKSPVWVTVVVTLAGVSLSATWWLQLRSYRDLNRAKFAVINDMEAGLGIAVFTKEWDTLKRDPVSGWRSRYAELGTAERVVPIVFAFLYVALLIVRLTR